MTRHLSGDERFSALEGALDAARAAHLEACAACRGEVTSLGAVLQDVRSDGAVPEPSPLFWDHFSARVRRAVASEPMLAPPRDWWRTAWAPVAGLLVLATAALVVVLRTPGSAPSGAPEPARPVQMAAADDGAWKSVGQMAANLSPDEVRRMVASAPATPPVVDELTPDEQRAFVNLVAAEMGGPGGGQ